VDMREVDVKKSALAKEKKIFANLGSLSGID
jgi:hypothetical protein